jgi:hypothetical protein
MPPTQPIRLKSEAEFGSLLAAVAGDMVTASIHWRLYNDLVASASEFLTELNQSRAFWTLTRDAHRDTALFRLARLYDADHRAVGLPRLLATIADNLDLFEAARFRERLKDNPHLDSLTTNFRRPDLKTLDEDARSVSEDSDTLVKRLVDLRHRLLAHRDPRVILGTVQDPVSALDAADVEALRERASTIVNRYNIFFLATSYSTQIVGHDDFKWVLRSVRSHLAARQREFEQEMERALRPSDAKS